MAFGATTFILSMYNVRAGGVATPNVVLGMALGYGGLVQLIAGIQEWACGNTFGATAFSSYGGFWFSFGTLYIPQFQVTGEQSPLSKVTKLTGCSLIHRSLPTS
jgi:succinate-acetate transporter protein